MSNHKSRIRRIREIVGVDDKAELQFSFSTNSIDDCRKSMEAIRRIKKELQLVSKEFALERRMSLKKIKDLAKTQDQIFDLLLSGRGSRRKASSSARKAIDKQNHEFEILEILIEKIHLRLAKAELEVQERIGYFRIQDRREPIPDEVQKFVWSRDAGRCVACGSNELLEFDHIIPLSKGGSNTARNIQLLCEACNQKKGSDIGRL